LNNFSHDSVGGQSTSSSTIDFSYLSKGFSYKDFFRITDKSHFESVFSLFQKASGPSLLEVVISKGSRDDLGRPDISPRINKKRFMGFLDGK